MADSREPVARVLRRWGDAASVAPRLMLGGVREAVIGVPLAILPTLAREGPRELPTKLAGDALARILGRSGPGLVKLGQLLATRADLLPGTLCRRLKALYTEGRPMSREDLRRTLSQAYPDPSPFQELDPVPIAVGSIAQVHRARLLEGPRVVVKVVRPGIRAALRRDMNALLVFLDLALRILSGAHPATRTLIHEALEDLARALEIETNLVNEAEAFVEFRLRLSRNRRVYVPRCYREWSTREVLVLEELRGTPLRTLGQTGSPDASRARQTARLALREILGQIFEEGRFHADPHAENLWLLDDGRLGMIDLGLTGQLSLAERQRLARAARGLLARDAEAASRIVLELGCPPPDFSAEPFLRDVREVLARSRSAKDAEPSAAMLDGVVNELLGVAGRHGIYLPPSTALMIRSVVTIEGVARSLDPEIKLLPAALPVLLRALRPRLLRWSYWRGAAERD